MKFFILLLFSISGIIISDLNTIFIGIVVLAFAIVLLTKKYGVDKRFIVICTFIFLLFLIVGLVNLKTFQEAENFTGIVIKRSEGYYIVFDGFERIYVKSDDLNIGLFDIIRINGNYSEISFSSIESEFDFKKYLEYQGISRQIYQNSYTHVLKLNINCSIFKNKIIDSLSSEKSKIIVNTILLDNIQYGSSLESALSSNSILYLFSLSGMYLNFFSYKLTNILRNYFKDWIALLISFSILAPILFLNIDSFITKRMIVAFLVNLICLKIRYFDSLGKRSIVYLLLLINKYNVYQYGFIMPLIISTFMSFSKLLFKRKKWYIKRFGSLLLMFLVVLPFTIEFNNSFNILTMVLSYILTPFIRILLVLMYPLILCLKVPFLEDILNLSYDILLGIDIRFLDVNIPPMNQFLICIYYLILVFLLYGLEINFKKIYKVGIAVYFSFIFLYSLPIKNTFTSSISFINVGQGDATLIRVKNKTILVDTGGSLYKDIATESLIPYLKKQRVYKIDAVFITHYDMDHYYALDSLKTNFYVINVYDYNNFNEYDNSILDIYNFNANFNEIVDENSRSLVLGFSLGGKKIMLMGDAPIEIEKSIINSYENIDCDILKVGHHGSKTSTSIELLEALSPEDAIISCGVNNMYGHPNKEVIDRLNEFDINIRRTDLEGTIEYIF